MKDDQKSSAQPTVSDIKDVGKIVAKAATGDVTGAAVAAINNKSVQKIVQNGLQGGSSNETGNDVADAIKATVQATTGNYVGAAVTVVKNKRFRRIIIGAVVVVMAFQVAFFLMVMVAISGAIDMIKNPIMSFVDQIFTTSSYVNGVQETQTIHFNVLANAWEHNLTAPEIAQVNQLQLGLSYGLLEAFFEMNTMATPNQQAQKIDTIATELQPNHFNFKAVQLRKVGVNAKGKKDFYDVTEQVLQNVMRYNGYWTVQYHIATEPSGSQIVVFDGTTLAKKDYTALYSAEKSLGFLHNLRDQQTLFAQALVLDRNFYDPQAMPMLQMLDGGTSSGAAPSKGVPMPKPQIVAILKQAITIDQVPLSWLPYLEIIVGHEDASGNPDAVDPILVDGENASGLMQMLPSTFWSDHVSGYNDIWNPLDNAVSAINHIKGAWGNPMNIPGVVSGVYTGY